MIRIRKPHDKFIDEMLENGHAQVSTGVGLYFSRLRKDLEDVAVIKPTRKDVFEISRGRDIMEKTGETFKHSKYRRTHKKWGAIL